MVYHNPHIALEKIYGGGNGHIVNQTKIPYTETTRGLFFPLLI